MSSVGLLSGLLHTQGSDPAGAKMQVEMLPIDWILPNPDNKIYHVGDVSQLAEDIRKNGVRQPLEVVQTGGMTYKLIGGERRLTACQELLDGGDDRFSSLPCIILESKGELDDRIALITANATARELTDGERLAQYEALKDALTAKKQAGQLEGKVRDALCKILGEGSGTLARLNAISANCTEDIKGKLHRGEIGLMEAYRYAQSVAETQRKAKQPEPPKTEPPKTLPQNPDYAEQKSPLEAIAMLVKKAHEEKKKVQTDAPQPVVSKGTPLPSVYNGQRCDYSASHQCEKETQEQPKEQSRGRDTLHKLAEKTLGANAAWELEWEEVRFRLAYYKQPLPGGAYLWKLCDTQRDAYGLAPDEHERYAIILNDGTFKTIGWELYNDALISLANYLDLQ